jgi:GT2 family glycosyltransferase
MTGEQGGTGLSVLTLVRDRNAMLGRLLDGLDAGDRPPAEVVVARCGGEDPRAVVGERPYPVRVIEVDSPDDRIPYSPARNRCAEAARTDAIAFVDADCIPTAGYVAALDDALAEVDALCTGEVLYLPPDAPLDAGAAELRRHGRPHPHRQRPPAEGVALGARHELVWGLHMALRRSTFLALGGFDEGYRGYAGEDTDLAITAREAGVPAALVAGAELLHQHHATWDPPLQQAEATVANAQRFRDRHGWWPMDGWLAAMADLGILRWTPDAERAEVLRPPTADELAAAHRPAALPFL